MKKWLISIIIGVCTMASALAASPAGQWQTFDDSGKTKKAVVQIIALNRGELIGKIVKLYQHPGAVCKNCKGNRKNKPIEGMTILWGLKPDGENQWDDGKIIDPENGKTYSLKAELSQDGKTLKLRGYIGFSLLGRTQVWKRIN